MHCYLKKEKGKKVRFQSEFNHSETMGRKNPVWNESALRNKAAGPFWKELMNNFIITPLVTFSE